MMTVLIDWHKTKVGALMVHDKPNRIAMNHIVQYILRHRLERPSPNGRSLILFSLPGTVDRSLENHGYIAERYPEHANCDQRYNSS